MQSSEIVFHAENADYTHGEMLSQGFQDLANRWLNWSENKEWPIKWNLQSDMGGIFGFFLGVSMVSVVHSVQKFYDRVMTRLGIFMWLILRCENCVTKISDALTMKHGQLIHSTLSNHSEWSIPSSFFGKLNFQLVAFKLLDSKVCIHGVGQGGFLTVISPIFNWHKV